MLAVYALPVVRMWKCANAFVAAHLLIEESARLALVYPRRHKPLVPGYQNGLLEIALDLGKR